eukprot:1156619-Pelagomonas_calceolata.AAC.8
MPLTVMLKYSVDAWGGLQALGGRLLVYVQIPQVLFSWRTRCAAENLHMWRQMWGKKTPLKPCAKSSRRAVKNDCPHG